MLVNTSFVLRLAIPWLVVTLIGCDGAAGPSGEIPRIRALASLHYMAKTNTGRPPASEQEFKQYVNEKGAKFMELAGVTSANELFISERDGQPFVIVYGTPPKGMHPDVVAYEQAGVDGVREVGMGMGVIEQADEARFKQLVPQTP